MPCPVIPRSSSQQPSADAHKIQEDFDTDMRSPQLYAFYKQATQDPPIDKAETPGTFDFKVSSPTPCHKCRSHIREHELTVPFDEQGKAKKRAWQKVVDEGVTPTSAQLKYVQLVESLKTKYGYDANKKPEAVGGS